MKLQLIVCIINGYCCGRHRLLSFESVECKNRDPSLIDQIAGNGLCFNETLVKECIALAVKTTQLLNHVCTYVQDIKFFNSNILLGWELGEY